MLITSNHIFDQDAHHGATFDDIWYLFFTCYIIPDVGNMMVFAGIAQAQPK